MNFFDGFVIVNKTSLLHLAIPLKGSSGQPQGAPGLILLLSAFQSDFPNKLPGRYLGPSAPAKPFSSSNRCGDLVF